MPNDTPLSSDACYAKTPGLQSLLSRPIAHPGLHSDVIPENSLAAFQWAINCDLPIECDVQLLADGRLIVFHNFDVGRMNGVHRAVDTLTAREAADLRLLQTCERLPFFEEMLEIVAGRVLVLDEMKSRCFLAGKLESAVVDAVAQYCGDYTEFLSSPGRFQTAKSNLER